MKDFKFALFIGATVAALAFFAGVASAAERVLIVGDETVVEAARQPYGFVNELRKTLETEKRDVEIVPLGVERATFSDWRALIAKSRDEDPAIDVEGVSLKGELDKGADLVFVFLGLNDVLKPAVRGVFKESGGARRGQLSPAQEEQLAEIKGFVDDLKNRAPGVKRVVLVAPSPGTASDWVSSQLYMIDSLVEQAAASVPCQVFRLHNVYQTPQKLAWFATDPIDLYRDGLHPSEYGSQLVTWALLISFDEKGYNSLDGRARSRYAGPPESLRKLDTDKPSEWEEIARRYYENRLDPRLRDFVSPGFSLAARYSGIVRLRSREDAVFDLEESTPNPIGVEVICATRGIEADQPVDEKKLKEAMVGASAFAPASKTPKIEIVSCGKLQYQGIEIRRSHDNNYTLDFKGDLADLPVDITVRIGEIEKTVRIEKKTDYYLSGLFNLKEPFSSLEDFPKEEAITSVDYEALANNDPRKAASTIARKQALASRGSGRIGDEVVVKTPPYLSWTPNFNGVVGIPKNQSEYGADPDDLDIAKFRGTAAYSGVYVLRYLDVPAAQTATLKLSVKGYKSHVVERVYLNGAQVFFGELNVDDPEKQEATVQVQLKEGLNVMIARVDHTEWDWIVGFKFIDPNGTVLYSNGVAP